MWITIGIIIIIASGAILLFIIILAAIKNAVVEASNELKEEFINEIDLKVEKESNIEN
ncbi:hypothetical protein [Candidatus Clostridium radicumherbarum]|jgi:hypothetical protein|uniref:Uncharacterized protein n=1 Tax=Candidatus Clostridium radicumherbarum TaxID=3381662 RepID=A0ABW8TTV6_9CLOT